MKYRVTVTVETREPVDPNDLAEHVAEASHLWGGQGDPESELFPTNMKRVTAWCRGYGVYSERSKS